jgi:hypothetical protein
MSPQIRILLCFAAIIWSGAEIRGSTVSIPSEVGDYGIYAPSTVTISDDRYRVGTELTPEGLQTNIVHLFPLPSLNGGQLIGADYSFNFIEKLGTPSFNVDVWGIGIQNSASPLAEFYFGNGSLSDGFAGNVKLQDDIVTVSTPVGVVHTDSIGDATLLNYLKGFYTGNPGYPGGAFAFLRLNHDSVAPSGLSGFMVTMQEYTGEKPVLTLDISTVPESSTFILAALTAMSLLSQTRARSMAFASLGRARQTDAL